MKRKEKKKKMTGEVAIDGYPYKHRRYSTI